MKRKNEDADTKLRLIMVGENLNQYSKQHSFFAREEKKKEEKTDCTM